ncbi:zinc finger protein ZFPM1 isoform B [Patagioenas fasciata monilis]|uniref:Zinc finger protein ZFPM1 n=1 Tax=Patagioenas fasciata monilis TaxID=372326 RepID=A0A1V4K1A4_PATFA|nr:zinc finger protein ZFPM1 isoform B [Patagioenas fasciata monilis]
MEDGPVGEKSPLEREGAASDREGSAERDASSPPGSEESRDAPESPKEPEKPDPGENPQEPDAWNGPDELDLAMQDGERRVRSRRSLPEGFSWGPFQGSIHSELASPGHGDMSPPVTLVLEDESCWLSRLPLVPAEPDANAVIYRKDEALWCRTTRALQEDEPVCAFVVAEPPAVPNHHAVTAEPGDSPYPAALRSDIQLLPQQAGMAAILATAVVNKDVFPCKDCGIWYRSERNLQAHLMYYCASRQSAGSPALEEKPKETYPNERVCPFPQCKKSCPSASSLEIHMRSHSGERPFVCLICLSAFTTKANCERHLKVHTDTLNGVCHSCGFISTTRDILYSHLVTNHMICQPGSKGEMYSPGPALPAAKPLTPGLNQTNNTSLRKGSLPAFLPEGLPALPQHVVLHGPLPTPPPGPDAVAPPAPPASPPNARAGKYVFGHEAAVVPQASEILAKMSELVHSRLKQGHGGTVPPTIYTGTSPAPKGATCFECEITFNNINNYYVHKRLYCSSRHLAEDSPPGGTLAGDGDTGRDATPPTAPPESPSSSAGDEGDEDPSKTLCEACNIRFSRHETYVPLRTRKRHTEGPIDLSKKPRRQGEPAPAPLLPLADYHECTACRISFHSLDSYLAHKNPGEGDPEGMRGDLLEHFRNAHGLFIAKPAVAGQGVPDTPTPPTKAVPSPMPNGNHRYCRLCNIKFSSLSTFIAHKKYYCSSHAAEHVK